MSSELDLVMSKYNLSLAENKDLREQLETKKKQWAERDKEFDVTKKLTRELCELILAKDKNQQMTGKQASWSSIPINELINSAKIVFRDYNNRRNDLMQRLADEIEDLQKKVADLKNEVMYYKTRPGKVNPKKRSTLTEEELDAAVQEEERQKPEKKEEKTPNTSFLSPGMQRKIESGDIRVQQAETVKEGLQSGDAVAIVEEEDIPVQGEAIQKENIRRNHAMNVTKTTPRSITTVRTPTLQEKYRKQQKSIEDEYDKDRLKGISDKITDIGWIAIRIFGETGQSRSGELARMIEAEAAKEGTIVSQRAAYALIRDLAANGVLFQNRIKTPLSGDMIVVQFTRDGGNIFRQKFKGSRVVMSEADRLLAEHGSLEHGYGILQCAEEIKKSGYFKTVNIFNRKSTAKVEDTSLEFIPDIYCEDENGLACYIEYELDHYNQREFNGKTKKIMMKVDCVNWITNNKETADSLIEKTKKMFEAEDNSFLTRHKIVRITTAKALKNMDLRKDSSWKYVFYPSKSLEPQVNF